MESILAYTSPTPLAWGRRFTDVTGVTQVMFADGNDGAVVDFAGSPNSIRRCVRVLYAEWLALVVTVSLSAATVRLGAARGVG